MLWILPKEIAKIPVIVQVYWRQPFMLYCRKQFILYVEKMDWVAHEVYRVHFSFPPYLSLIEHFVSRKSSMISKEASTHSLQCAFILLVSKNVRGFCFAFIFFCPTYKARDHLPFVLGSSWKIQHMVNLFTE